MKITYNENPLRTTVELDEHNREVLWWKIKASKLEELLVSINCSLREGQFFDIDRARKYSALEYYLGDEDNQKSPLDKRVDRLVECYSKELMGSHCGDCTCVPASCLKCHAEVMLGINTLNPFPGKHELAQINGAFTVRDHEDEYGYGEQRTIVDALEKLKNYKVDKTKPESWENTTQEQWEVYTVRWEEEGARAYEWLKVYAREHFGVTE